MLFMLKNLLRKVGQLCWCIKYCCNSLKTNAY